MLSISTRHPPSLRRAAALAAVTLAVCLSCLTITVRADSDIVFVTTITYALAKDPEVLRTACAVVQKNATPLVSPAMDTFAGLSAAMAAASVNYAYVSATMDTEQSNVWLWRNGGDLTSFGGIVTGNKWATNYPLNTSSLPYAVYSASLGALINVDGTTSYPIACTSDYYVPPVEELKGKKKKKFPWWGILIIVLGSVVIIAVVVTIVVCCCCCKKKAQGDDEAVDSDNNDTRSFDNNSVGETSVGRSGATPNRGSDDESERSSIRSGDTTSNSSFSTESAKESAGNRVDGRAE
ncbi:hypothetical protein N2W54_002470 [Lotmaria passim]